jgi:VanZ family protein
MANMHWFRRWGPVVGAAMAIWIFSTQAFSDVNTERFVIPCLAWLFPGASYKTLFVGHQVIRKVAHVVVYFAFGLLVLRAIRSGRKDWKLSWGLEAFLGVAGYAVLDELHQSFVPMRHPSARDVLLDSLGGFLALAVVWSRHYLEQKYYRHPPPVGD